MRAAWIVSAVLLTAPVVRAQAPTAPPPAGAEAAPPAAPAPGAASALEPAGYTYDPQGRRDPFVSLVRRGTDAPGSAPATRPAGLAGFTADELSLRGTFKGRQGYVAMMQATDNKTYLVRPGDKLLDGSVRTITADSVVILQRVNDPLTLETQREVRKLLRQTEEAK